VSDLQRRIRSALTRCRVVVCLVHKSSMTRLPTARNPVYEKTAPTYFRAGAVQLREVLLQSTRTFHLNQTSISVIGTRPGSHKS
jgi:hypothetical protein